MIAFYLSAKDLALILKNLSRYWNKYVKDQKLWQMIDKVKALTINERLQVTQNLVERRSKGKLYIAVDRLTNERLLLRKIFLDVTNAGQDDGLPTSILREISHLQSLNHQNVGKIRFAEVKSELAQIVYECYDQNLKEYTRKHSKIMQPTILQKKERP